MRTQIKNSIFLGITFLVFFFTSACSQKRGGTTLQANGLVQLANQLRESGCIEGNSCLSQIQGMRLKQIDQDFVLSCIFDSRCSSGIYTLRPALTFQEITSGARVFAEGDMVYMTGAGEGFGSFSFNSGFFMSGRAALTQGTTQGVNLFSSGNVRSVRSMTKIGNYLFISSDSGLFQFDVSNPSSPTIFNRLPDSGPAGADVSAFQWNSMVFEPQTQQLLGFRGNQLFTLRPSERIPRLSQLGFNIDCGRGAAHFNGKIYVAGCSQLWVMNLQTQSGSFQASLFSRKVNARLVASTSQFLYVYHAPVAGSESVNVRAGIYVFDRSENLVKVINLPQIQSFSVSGDDRFIIANDTDARVVVFRIPWRTQ